jgi:hypothetical protein
LPAAGPVVGADVPGELLGALGVALGLVMFGFVVPFALLPGVPLAFGLGLVIAEGFCTPLPLPPSPVFWLPESEVPGPLTLVVALDSAPLP